MIRLPFQANVRVGERQVKIEMQGELDIAAGETLRAAFVVASTEASRLETGRILLDFNRVSYINSTGIALIVNILGEARKNGYQLGAYGLSPHYHEIFEITRLSEFIHLYPDEVTALAIAR